MTRSVLHGPEGFARVGDGEIGGKARGLAFFREKIEAEHDPRCCPSIDIGVPDFAVIATDLFDVFLERNGLATFADSDADDEAIAHAFQEAVLPDELVEFLEALVDQVRVPLAVRSSGLLEDTIRCPFAGVYGTKMVPNDQPDRRERLRSLREAIKFVYASTFFDPARTYLQAAGQARSFEPMAVILQEIVGTKHGERFYPHLSGVARSHNFYATQGAKPEDGVVMLALGLGKTIVDGGVCWSYAPSRPKAPPPYGSVRELLRNTQLGFWFVRLGESKRGNPIEESEYLAKSGLAVAEADGTLAMVASTYDRRSDRLVPGTGIDGPRVLNFSPLLVLETLPFNEVIRSLLSICERAAGSEVEIEFAVSLSGNGAGRARLGFLQARPMWVSHDTVEIGDDELEGPDLLLKAHHVMGNGSIDDIRDVVYVRPEPFDPRLTPVIAGEIGRINEALFAAGRPYLLIGFGRWGSADSWLGIPVDWSKICGARVIVEATLPAMNVEPSQGSHFFHNIASLGVSYLTVRHDRRRGVDWQWLDRREAVDEGRFLRHIRFEKPLKVKVDGRSGRAGVWR